MTVILLESDQARWYNDNKNCPVERCVCQHCGEREVTEDNPICNYCINTRDWGVEE